MKRRHDIQDDDTQHKDIQHNDIQHKGFICDTQHNEIQHNNTSAFMLISPLSPVLNIFLTLQTH